MDSTATCMRLEIESREPMRGLLFVGDAPARAFEGWLQLISALSAPDVDAALRADTGSPA